MTVDVHGSCFPWFKFSFSLFRLIIIHYHTKKATLRAEGPFPQWQWLFALQLSEGTQIPLQILKAMPERNICLQASKQKIYPKI